MLKKIEKRKIRTRIAPSPTGAAHIGTARTALFNYLFAKQNKGKFILRVEDTDLQRSEQRWTDEIIEQLKWLGIEWDEGPDIGGKFGPYKQSQRLDIYEKYLKHGKTSVIRFRVSNKKIKFHDSIRQDVEFDAGLLGDVVIAKNLKTPLYHFAVVVDDFLMQISHVIRGEEHLSNTPRQILLQEALGFYQPIYAHLPLMLNPDRSKLSKRQGDVALSDYHNKGYLPEALVNFMVLLGWNPGTEKELFTLPQLVKEFSIEKVQKAGAIFNLQRLDFLNGLYIREKPIEKLTELCAPYLKEAGILVAGQASENKLEKIIEVSRTRMKKLSDICELSDFLFKDKLIYDKDLLKWQKMGDSDIKDSLAFSEKMLSEIKKWDLKNLEKELLPASEKFNLKKGYPGNNKGFLLWPLRVALSGKKTSPSPFEIAEILGKEKTLKRIADAIKIIS